jgi:hypothetical protein
MTQYQFHIAFNSKAYKECVNYVKQLEGKTITEKEKNEIINKYMKQFIQEHPFDKSMYSGVKQTFLSTLFNEYNVNVVKEEENINTNTTYYIEKKTAPTLADGWFIYILLMLIVSIFYERVFGWIMITIWFVIWRNNEINKYN